jgi:hypothetical protein
MHRFGGEPDLAEILADPIVQALMRADGCALRSFYDCLDGLRVADGAAGPCGCAPSREDGERTA